MYVPNRSSGELADGVRPLIDLALSPHLLAADRVPLPAYADVFRLCRRGAATLRTMGGRLDDSGPAAALPTLGHVGDRSRTSNGAARCSLVPALALCTVARRQCRYAS